ncbi:MAG TPA: cytochrome c biogenesis protein CcsA [Cytophagales bacterium]|nr:cytochrome c biogenesis protein CcsA [Cytophagales bacterium]
MKFTWWKILAILLLLYTVIGGFLMDVPRLTQLQESIRNQFFHVPMWFSMILLLIGSVGYAIAFLRTSNLKYDIIAAGLANTAIVLGVLGLLTGIIWMKFTWISKAGVWWVNDPKLNCTVIGMLIYLAYFILRGSLDDPFQKARISSVYNIFAFATLIPLLFVLPRLTDSLHPGNGGNPGFNAYDMDNKLRMIFYPAVLGFTLLGVWISSLWSRLVFLKQKMYENS